MKRALLSLPYTIGGRERVVDENTSPWFTIFHIFNNPICKFLIEIMKVRIWLFTFKSMKTHSHGFYEKPNYKWDV